MSPLTGNDISEAVGSETLDLTAAWRAFKERFRTPLFHNALAARIGGGVARATELTEIYLAEADVGLKLVTRHLEPNLRILEVGAGMGLLSAFLAERGYHMTAMEPVEHGFGFMAEANALVRQHTDAPGCYRFLDIGAEALRRDHHRTFDLIYSVNVLEHITDLPAALSAMAGVLAPGGRMVHLCPNYAVPYEPHLAIPLVPFFPRATAWIFPRAVRRHQAVWDGLSFVTPRKLAREARRNELSMRLVSGVMWQFIDRMEHDPQFTQRHRGLLPLALRISRAMGLLRLVRYLPPEFQTPMVATLTRAARGAADLAERPAGSGSG